MEYVISKNTYENFAQIENTYYINPPEKKSQASENVFLYIIEKSVLKMFGENQPSKNSPFCSLLIFRMKIFF